MLSLLFICLVLAGKSFDNNKIRQQQDFKYDALPPFPPILTAGGGGKKQTKGNLHYMYFTFSVISKDYLDPKTATRFINWLKKSKQEAAMKELPPQVGGVGPVRSLQGYKIVGTIVERFKLDP